jgi:hypothetical protein
MIGLLRFGMESGAVEQLSRITKVVGRNSKIHGRDLNAVPPDYDAALLACFSATYGYMLFSHALCSQTSSVGVVTERLRGRGFIPRKVKMFPFPNCPDQIWGPLSLLFNIHLVLFSLG